MYKFKILRGVHADDSGVHQAGDEFTTTQDLTKFNAPSAEKFQLVGRIDPSELVTAVVNAETEEAAVSEELTEAELQLMSAKDLKNLCNEEGVNPPTLKKTDMIAALLGEE